MMITSIVPAGAITSVADLELAMLLGDQIYSVNGPYPKVVRIPTADSYLDKDNEIGIRFVARDDNLSFFLNDYSVGEKNYNSGNYIFLNAEEAAVWEKQLLTDPVLVRARNEWHAYCNRFDQYYDNYDNYDDYDDYDNDYEDYNDYE